MDITEELYRRAEMCAQDPAFIAGFKDHLVKTGLWAMMGGPAPIVKRQTPPPAAPTQPTAIQAGLFDNWPNGTFVLGTPNRFGMVIEVWDAPADEIEAYKVRSMNHAFKTNVSLMDRRALKAQVKHLRKPRINKLTTVDPDYLDALEAMARGLPDDNRVGLFNTNIKTNDSEYERGVYYHPFQFVIAVLVEGEVKSASLILGIDHIAAPIALAKFVDRDAAGKSLGQKVVAQSRLDIVGFDGEWNSNRH